MIKNIRDNDEINFDCSIIFLLLQSVETSE